MVETSDVLEAVAASAKPGSRVLSQDGLTWWQDGLQQRVQLETMVSTRGVTHTRIKVCTDLVDGFDGSDDDQLKVLDLFSRYAGISAMVRSDSDPAKLKLTAAYCYESSQSGKGKMVASWLPWFQMAEARGAVQLLEEMGRFTKTETAPPAIAEMDESGHVWDTSQLPYRESPSSWVGSMEGLLSLLVHRGICLSGSANEEQLTAEFAYPGKAGILLLRMSATEVHPRLGAGLLVRMTLPMDDAEVPPVEDILGLNAAEAGGFATVFGSWCRSDEGLTHVTFLPDAIMSDINNVDVGNATLHRIEWISRYPFNENEQEVSEEAAEPKTDMRGQLLRAIEEWEDEIERERIETGGVANGGAEGSSFISKTFHERLAEKAIQDGETPGQFRDAARRHASAFWGWATFGGLVWFFFGLWWALIPVAAAVFRALQSVSSTLVARNIEEVVARSGGER